ncbi:hypothetical protein EC988_001691 [Linderina pennispora]|nr:hypothetical protein EC988_001691 [Linderina pennispora]
MSTKSPIHADIIKRKNPYAVARHTSPYPADILAGLWLIGLGIYFIFIGRRFSRTLATISGYALVGGLVLFIEYNAHAPRIPETALQVGYVVSGIAVGAIGGVAGFYFNEFGHLVTGVLGGFALGTWVLAFRDRGLIQSETGRIVFLIVCMACSALCVCHFDVPGTVAFASIFGAYALMIGIDCFARTGYVSSATSFFLFPGSSFRVTSETFAMQGGVVAAVVVGCVVQTILLRRQTRKAMRMDEQVLKRKLRIRP